MAAANPTRQQLLEMYKNSKGSVASTPSAPARGFGTDITNNRLQIGCSAPNKSTCSGSVGMVSATLKRAREVEDYRGSVNEFAKRQQHESSPSERFKSFFGASATATPAAATPSRLRQLLSGSSSTPTAASTPQRASIIPTNSTVTPRSASLRPNPSPSPSSQRPASSTFACRPDTTPKLTPVNANKENARNSICSAVINDDRLMAANQQLQIVTQASATLQKQVEALRSERKTLKEQLAAKDNAIEQLQKQLQEERVKTARLGVDNAKLQSELRRLGGGVIPAPSPYALASASTSRTTAAPLISQQSSHDSHFVAPKISPRFSSTAIAPPPPPPPPPPPAPSSAVNKSAPVPAPTLPAKQSQLAPTASKQSSASLLSQALSEISSKVNSLRHVPPSSQTERRKSSDPSNWIEAALQQRRALIDNSDMNDSNASVASDW